MGENMRIDIYNHLIPRKYWDTVVKVIGNSRLEEFVSKEALGVEMTKSLWDLDERFKILDKYESLFQVLIPSGPPLELIAKPQEASDLARLYNDEMADLVAEYPDRFLGAVAFLPMNDIDAALRETERAIESLGLKGVLLQTPIYSNSPEITKPIDSQELLPLYDRMAEYELPIWIHPKREFSTPDYTTEDRSKYLIHQMFGWPYETTVAMARLVYSGLLERYPALKLIIHHSGGMVPFFADRIIHQCEWYKVGLKARFLDRLTRPAVEYFRKFYVDTAVYGNTSALMCSYSFFGPDHLLFGTDMPYDSELGNKSIKEVIKGIAGMDILDSEREKIFEKNTKSLLKFND
jgi:aminocarboxymuconate-semialdehyde decarboxylase